MQYSYLVKSPVEPYWAFIDSLLSLNKERSTPNSTKAMSLLSTHLSDILKIPIVLTTTHFILFSS